MGGPCGCWAPSRLETAVWLTHPGQPFFSSNGKPFVVVRDLQHHFSRASIVHLVAERAYLFGALPPALGILE
jgi:hypothetical protein